MDDQIMRCNLYARDLLWLMILVAALAVGWLGYHRCPSSKPEQTKQNPASTKSEWTVPHRSPSVLPAEPYEERVEHLIDFAPRSDRK